MKVLVILLLCVCYSYADVNILIIGSGRSFSEGRGNDHQDALKPKEIAAELKKILTQDKSVGKVNVSVDEYYTKKHIDTYIGGRAGQLWKLEYHRYSLAQYYFWPEGRAERLKNLQGKWDYVILIDDPYLTANMPGIHAEGVKLLSQEISKGKGKTLIFSQWPREGSNKSADELDEISRRVASGLGIYYVPAAYAWSKLKKDKTDTNFIAANSIYRRIFFKNRTVYEYKKPELDGQIKSAMIASTKKQLAKSAYTSANPFAMKLSLKRQYWGHHTGTSTERGLTKQLQKVFSQGATHFNKGKKPAKDKIDFNYGRANSAFEPNKKYKVAPEKYARSYGIVMQDNGKTAYETMLYGIDRRNFTGSNRYDDGTDMGIAYDMIRQNEVEKDIRTIPGRIMNAKIMDYNKDLIPVNTKGDIWHQRGHLLLAQASFVYTTLTGRYGIDIGKKAEGQDWMMTKIGYDTAWTMSTLQARSPGFIVRPSNVNTLSLKKDQEETLKIYFANKPKSPVKVQISVDGTNSKVLTFDSANYNSPQTFKFKNSQGKAVKVALKSLSNDSSFNGLHDEWQYKSE